ncbi:MAG: sn-glycerol-1-phosphate dehydrogenase [Nitrososphaerota archaeon]
MTKGHLMELPVAVYVGEDTLSSLGEMLEEQSIQGPLSIATGPNVRKILGKALINGLDGYNLAWVNVKEPTQDFVNKVIDNAKDIKAKAILGFGGGKTIDVAKKAAYELRLPMISVPTSASHDGISSPFASLRDASKPYSFKTRPPTIIAVDIRVVMSAPERLMRGGFGDLVAKVTAVKDWELARDKKGEYFGEYSASLARMSAELVIEKAEKIGSKTMDGTRVLIEALISSGVAAGIAGSSRPCSGSEHLISHALELIAPGIGLHGEKTGIATIAIAKLYGLNWNRIADALKRAGSPVSFSDLNLTKRQVVDAILTAPSIRPERYTILHELKLDKEDVTNLVEETGIA